MPWEKIPHVYIMASGPNQTIYLGVTSNLRQRIWQHKNGTFSGFSDKYETKDLVWFERHATMERAIAREKQLKKYTRAWKLAMIEKLNPDWEDLAYLLGE